MNTILKYILFSFLFVLSSCSGEDVFVANEQSPRDALVLTVSAGDFVTDGNPATRAADAGATTTFENGDKVGVIILDGKGTPLFNNIPYKYNGGSWQFDNSNTENKTQCYYDNKAKTYIVYYPYSAAADGVTNAIGLKDKFVPQDDQSTEENYRISDLLVWTSTPGTPLKTLNVELKHAYASVSVSPIIKYTLQDGNSTEVSFVSSKISEVGLTINSNSSSKFYPAEDGSYRYILPTGFSSGDVSCVLTFNGKKYSCTVTFSTSVSANTRYTFVPTVKGGEYDLDKAQIGDFYCKSSDGSTGYLIPGDVASLTDAQKTACLGVVMKVGRGTDEGNTGQDNKEAYNWKDEDIYKLKDGTTEMDIIHGYVLALKDGNSGKTCAWGSDGTTVGTDQAQYTLFCGYENTQKIKEYVAKNTGKTLQTDFPAAYHASEGYEQGHASPSNSSGWFLPSAGQCWYWYQNRDLLKKSMDKAEGDGWQSYYWSSSEGDDGPANRALWVNFGNGGVSTDPKYNGNYNRVRSSLAF